MTHTNDKHELRTLLDLVQLPDDKFERLLPDLISWRKYRRNMADTILAGVREAGFDLANVEMQDYLIWIDDGKNDGNIRLNFNDENGNEIAPSQNLSFSHNTELPTRRVICTIRQNPDNHEAVDIGITLDPETTPTQSPDHDKLPPIQQLLNRYQIHVAQQLFEALQEDSREVIVTTHDDQEIVVAQNGEAVQ